MKMTLTRMSPLHISVFMMRSILANEELEFVEPTTIIEINVGGQVFEVAADTLIREPFSILAAFCRKKSLFNQSNMIYVDRDWWIFRHILAFLKSNVLPTELDTLRELYTEATFYRLDGLKKAIENIPVQEIAHNSRQLLSDSR